MKNHQLTVFSSSITPCAKSCIFCSLRNISSFGLICSLFAVTISNLFHLLSFVGTQPYKRNEHGKDYCVPEVAPAIKLQAKVSEPAEAVAPAPPLAPPDYLQLPEGGEEDAAKQKIYQRTVIHRLDKLQP